MNAIRIVMPVLYLILAPLIGALLEGCDRKISARMQRRVGPPIRQPIYDIIKLFKKQVIGVDKAQGFLLVTNLILTALTGCLFFLGVDLLMVFFIFSTSSVFLYLAVCVTGSPTSNMSAQRELIQEMAVEPATLFTALGFYLVTGSFSTVSVITRNVSAIAATPGFFVAFCFVLTVRMRKSPFDTALSEHAHQELVRGITTEMGARNLAIFQITEWYETVMMLGVAALFFINSHSWSVVLAIVVILVLYFLLILLDNCCARLKWKDMLMDLWIVTLLFDGINLIILMMI